METLKTCRLCLSDTELNISLSSNYCKQTDILDKIFYCLRLHISDNGSICYECATNVERFYDFTNRILQAQSKLVPNNRQNLHKDVASLGHKRVYSSYVREQVIDAEYTFSFLEKPEEEPKVTKPSSPLFSYFCPSNALKESLKAINENSSKMSQKKKVNKNSQMYNEVKGPRNESRDLFDSESQYGEEPRSFDWKLTPDDDIMKRIKENFFGRLDF